MEEYHEGLFAFLKTSSIEEYQRIADGRIPCKQERPFCLVIKDPGNSSIFWAIPISSQVDIYKKRAEHAPDKFRFYRLMGHERCFNISSMIPIRSDDIHNIYERRGVPVKLALADFEDLYNHVSRILRTPDRWEVVISQVNVKELYKAVVQKIEREESGL